MIGVSNHTAVLSLIQAPFTALYCRFLSLHAPYYPPCYQSIEAEKHPEFIQFSLGGKRSSAMHFYLLQGQPKIYKFQNDCTTYHLLEEVFGNQGATGDFNSGFENEPRTSAKEQDMETAA